MRYATQVSAGAERRVEQLLRKQGVTHVNCAMAGYVCWEGSEEVIPMLKTVRGVHAVLPVTDEDTGSAEAADDRQPIRGGDLVTIPRGPYMNLTGRVEAVQDGKVFVHLTLLGRLVPVEVAVECVQLFRLPEVWR
jgi:hypothetical protein